MACIAYSNSDYFLFFTLLCSSFIYAWAFSIYKSVEKSASAILYNLYALMIYLVLTGGAQGTGPIWIFIVSPVTFSIRGLRRGIFDILLFLLAVVLAFYCAHTFSFYDYQPSQFPYRILFSFIIVAMLSGFYENSREKYNQKILALSKKNELLATIDPLTGLPNRRYTMNKLKEFKLALTKEQTPFVLILCDVDNFKKVNDEYGHSFGDEALIHLANILNQHTPNNAVASRWGGEEFLIAIPHVFNAKGEEIANKIHAALKQFPVNTSSQSLSLTISMGVVQSRESDSIDLDIKRADELLYKAKEQGKNRTCSE
ncbi:diguanylate cyclase [Pseudoalteromonas sp. 10-33]|nr:diguanylate cyclase [Pseudoalteromonas sp. 10-33]